jgi:hypothetical protein
MRKTCPRPCRPDHAIAPPGAKYLLPLRHRLPICRAKCRRSTWYWVTGGQTPLRGSSIFIARGRAGRANPSGCVEIANGCRGATIKTRHARSGQESPPRCDRHYACVPRNSDRPAETPTIVRPPAGATTAHCATTSLVRSSGRIASVSPATGQGDNRRGRT